MGSVKEFFEGLSDVQKDLFVSVINDLNAGAMPDKIERLSTFYNQLKLEIDQINKRRQSLGYQINNIETLLKTVDESIKREGDSLEMSLFQTMLQKLAVDLRAEVAALKPEKKLEKKFDVARRKESLSQRQRLAAHIYSSIIDNKRHKPSVGTSTQEVPGDAVMDEPETSEEDE